MLGELLKYVFDESKKGGLKNVISAIIKIAASFICLGPIMIYVSLYNPAIINNMNLITTVIILGCSCILFFIVFICSEIFATILLTKKLKTPNTMNDEKIEKYYFSKSLFITTIFQGILSLTIVINYLYKHPSFVYAQHLEDLSLIILIVIGYIAISVGLWILYLLKYVKRLKLRLLNNNTDLPNNVLEKENI